MLGQLLWTAWLLRPCWPVAGLTPSRAGGQQGAEADLLQVPTFDDDSGMEEAQQRLSWPVPTTLPPTTFTTTLPTETPLEGGPYSSLSRVYVINVGSAGDRWQHMLNTLGSVFGHNGLPRMDRFDAATPQRDDCDLPYSMNDCCTASHLAVMTDFSRDPNSRSDQWALVLEDDIALHPHINPEQLNEVVEQGLAKATQVNSPFLYLGLCAPQCRGARSTLTGPSGATIDFQRLCGGACTHAYAVQKFVAGSLPGYIRAMGLRARTIDAALSLVATGLNMSLLGGSHSSPDVRALGTHHVGVFYMKAFDDSLTTSSEWDKRVKVAFRLSEWSGRIGNLMFQWATVVGLAARANAETQAYFQVYKWKEKAECPAVSFFKHFRLQRFSRDTADLNMPKNRHPEMCTVYFKEQGPNLYKDADVTKLFSSIQAIKRRNAKLKGDDPDRCRSVEVVVTGYLQSWKYFDSSQATILRAYAAPPESKARADAWLSKLRTGLERDVPGSKWVFVGVQVRRGDKVHDPNFASVYFNAEWGFYRTAMRLVEKRLRKDHNNKVKVAFAVTAGGSMASNSGDVQEAKDALREVSEYVFFTSNSDAFTDFAVLSASDGIVISAGSFGWWSAYLSPAGRGQGLVVAPKYLYQPTNELVKGYSADDYYPSNWELMRNDISDDIPKATPRAGAPDGSAGAKAGSEPGGADVVGRMLQADGPDGL